jgi:hypothetical protein
MRYSEIIEAIETDDALFGPTTGIEKAWHGVARYMSWFPKVYTVLRQSGKIYGELKNRTGRSDPEFDEIVAVATPPELVALSAELKKIAKITEWEYQRQRRVDENDDDMFSNSGDFTKNIKSSVMQATDPYRRLVLKVRALSKELLGVSARVSASPTAVGKPVQKLSRATFLFGFGKFPQGTPKSLELSKRMQEKLTALGLESKITRSGWLSVKVPPPFTTLDEAPEDDMFSNRENNRFKIFGLAGVDYSTFDFSDIDRADWPDLNGYVSYAEFKPGLVPSGYESLNDDELEHLNDALYRAGHMYDLLYNKLFESK